MPNITTNHAITYTKTVDPRCRMVPVPCPIKNDAITKSLPLLKIINGCLYSRAAKFYLTKDTCVKGLIKISSYFTLNLIKVGKLKRFKKVSSHLKTILKTDLANLRFLEF